MKNFQAAFFVTIVVTICVLSFCASLAVAQEPAESAPAPAPLGGTVVATIGTETINTWQVDQIMGQTISKTPQLIRRLLTDEQIQTAKKMIVEQLIRAKLLETYVAKLPCSEEELNESKTQILADAQKSNPGITLEQISAQINDDMLRQQIRGRKLQTQALAQEKVDALIQSSPVSYFDGTTVKASHIIISCKPFASQAEKDQARAKLRGIADEISAGTVDFAEAARKNSTGPSAQKGGDLGQFSFEKMAFPFSQAAFALKTGQVSDIVETQFGYHIINVSQRTDGSGEAGPNAQNIAKKILMSQLQDRILRESLAENPVSIADEFK